MECENSSISKIKTNKKDLEPKNSNEKQLETKDSLKVNRVVLSDTTKGLSDIDKNNFIAVLRVDEDLLEKENKSKLYLYRNAQGGNEGNIMERDLLFDEANGKDIKNIKLLISIEFLSIIFLSLLYEIILLLQL